jgi:hypothetical protein
MAIAMKTKPAFSVKKCSIAAREYGDEESRHEGCAAISLDAGALICAGATIGLERVGVLAI